VGLAFTLVAMSNNKVLKWGTGIISIIIWKVGYMVWGQNEEVSFDFITANFNSNPMLIWYMIMGCFGVVYVMNTSFNQALYTILKANYDMTSLQCEYHNILENLDDALISETTQGLKYFNKNGYNVLKECAKLQEKDTECTELLVKMNENI